ncbi:hypothetical protein KSP40_PGU016221 [Platanthera guangdongensis]|uniref:glutathione transferase n=1 Tax=Platanthera guangdongensis TaxID=2320717 RepID=A0ABR2N4G6_9ASPA
MANDSKNLNRAESPKLQLYSYWRSSSAQRVRIILNLKGLEYESKPVNLLKNEQSSPEFVKLNPLKFVPVLVDGDALITDSFAISLYLEEKYPEHPLLPKDLKNKALNFQVASIVGSSIQPLQNLAVLNYIEERFGSNEKFPWAQYHIINGFEALEILLKDVAGKYATGDEPQLGAQIRDSLRIVYFRLTIFQFHCVFSVLVGSVNSTFEVHFYP